jgi:uncharacterized Zn finger protein
MPECPSTFWVTGSRGDLYQVNAHLGTCHCADFSFRGVKCKHQHLVSAYLVAQQIRLPARPHLSHADEVALIANADYFNAVAESIGW